MTFGSYGLQSLLNLKIIDLSVVRLGLLPRFCMLALVKGMDPQPLGKSSKTCLPFSHVPTEKRR